MTFHWNCSRWNAVLGLKGNQAGYYKFNLQCVFQKFIKNKYFTLSGIVYATLIPSGSSGTGPDAAFSSSSEISDTNSMPLHQKETKTPLKFFNHQVITVIGKMQLLCQVRKRKNATVPFVN